MANQWAFIVGINQYPVLQPLMYAQADAVAVRNFFVDELGLSVAHCLLLTDMSTAVEPHAQRPTRDALKTQLHQLCQTRVQPGDLLWVFFSGYGLTAGGQDYWMPVDGDPERLSETGVPLAWVLKTLKEAPTDNIVVALDISRSQGAIGHQNIGQQTAELARDFAIPTFLASQPEQYSHETMAVRHGLFTQALLEGLRYHGCVTVGQLADYLSDRLPELSQHHWRPAQNPVTMVPPGQKFMLLVPAAAVATLPMTERASSVTPAVLDAVPSAPAAAAPPQALPDIETQSIGSVPGDLSPLATQVNASPASAATKPRQPRLKAGALWNWGLVGAAVVLLTGVWLRTQSGQELPLASSPTQSENSAPLPSEGTAGSTDPLQPTPDNLGAAQRPPLARAEAALAAGRYEEARDWLALVPAEDQTRAYQQLQQDLDGEAVAAAERNQALLDEARRMLQPTSASVFNDAIEAARQVPAGDPYYEQAQVNIERWSWVILDMAVGRASVGNIDGAIAAAQLVPNDLTTVHEQAQRYILSWQQQLANRQLVQQADAMIEPGQASTFQDGLNLLWPITPDQPEYRVAQGRINQWSEDILVIARARAAQGRFADAIAAAQLVPIGTDSYEQAQVEITRWQGQL
jgi:hypothetical protein